MFSSAARATSSWHSEWEDLDGETLDDVVVVSHGPRKLALFVLTTTTISNTISTTVVGLTGLRLT